MNGIMNAFPLDLDRTSYSYIERPNSVILSLLEKYVFQKTPSARVLDVGCGAGANARAIRATHAGAHILGIEPNSRAAELASEACDDVFNGLFDDWLRTKPTAAFDAVVLSDVVEHIPDPVKFLRSLVGYDGLKDASFVVSVPNYAVWYNRALTLAGRFRYGWSGLYDRTHLRFYTRKSIRELLTYVDLHVVEDQCTPSLVQSMAPALRMLFDKDVAEGNHLSLPESRLYRAYASVVEPIESRVCEAWPELLGFQIVSVATKTA